MAEELYQNLVRSVDASAPESVHMATYPESDHTLIDGELSKDVRTVMRAVSLGRAARSKAGTKVRNIRLVDGVAGHDIDCSLDGIGAMQLKSEFVRKA